MKRSIWLFKLWWNVWLEYMAHGCADNPHLTIARLFPHPLFFAWRAI
jgi:hypothetical protein